MNYTAKLDSGQEIHLENDNEQTNIALSSSESGSSQNQSSSFQTGKWSGKPTLHSIEDGFVAEIATDDGKRYIHIKGNGIEQLNDAPDLNDAKAISLHETDKKAPKMKPMEPMKPMKPIAPIGSK